MFRDAISRGHNCSRPDHLPGQSCKLLAPPYQYGTELTAVALPDTTRCALGGKSSMEKVIVAHMYS